MLTLYFSGTGNTKYIAELFSRNMESECHSIEENIDFSGLITQNPVIAFCYPIYGSSVPRIMREFVVQNLHLLNGKKIIIFCTQLIFSGDGARAFTDLLCKIEVSILYAEHFNMPNNLCNIPIFSVKNGPKTRKHLLKAQKKMAKTCQNIRQGIIVKRGFHKVTILLGKSQSAFWPKLEEKHKDTVIVTEDCINCNLCVKICPMQNLNSINGQIRQNGNCILCHRCVNACPQKAITVLLHGRPKKQYKGITSL